MKIKKTIKRIGKSFFTLKQEDEGIIGQSVLIVDNGYSWLGQLNSGIETVKHFFPRAEITVLTFEQRKNNLQKNFPVLNYILFSAKLRLERYRVALQMLKMRKRQFDFIVLFSLDVTQLIVSLFFLKSKLILHNRWKQWWSLRLRDIKEIAKISYVQKKARFSFKSFFKKIGLFFILLQREDEEVLRPSILIVDNGYALFGQIDCAIRRIKESLTEAKISVLTLEQRKELADSSLGLEIIKAGNCAIKKYRLARHMLRLRKHRYDYIILLSLDITPIIVSKWFMKSKVLLYNRWHQWWSLKPKSIRGYLALIPQFIFNIITLAYLLGSVSWVFLKRSFNVFRFRFLRKMA